MENELHFIFLINIYFIVFYCKMGLKDYFKYTIPMLILKRLKFNIKNNQ